jgi:hypothetical protein
MLKETTGVDIHDPAVLAAGFDFLNERTDELRVLYRRLERQRK